MTTRNKALYRFASIKTNLRCIALTALLGLPAAQAFHGDLPEGLTAEEATWLWGHHSIPGHITRSGTPYWYVYPHTDAAQITNPAWSEVAATHITPGAKAPAVLVLHRCSGLPQGSTEYRRYFIETGFAVFEPDSFARTGAGPGDRPCNRHSYRLRVKEVEQALHEIRQLDWVDQRRLFLMGFGEGGKVVAEWDRDEFAGHIILGANCWSHRGTVPTGPRKVPVLAVVGEKDPYLNGSICAVNSQIPGSRSFAIKGAGHYILDYPETGRAIDTFIRTVLSE